MLSAPDSEAQPGGNGARQEQADAPPLVENHTQRENENDTQGSDGRNRGGGNRLHGGSDFGDFVADSRGGNQPRGMAEGAYPEGVSDGQIDKAHTGAPVAGDSGNPSDSVGGRDLAHSQPPVANKSVSQIDAADRTDKSVKTADKSVANVLDFKGFKSRRLTSQSVADFDKKHWKRSRVKPGWLIRRLTGYSIVENEYGVQYLGVVSRKPDRMSADSLIYPLAGFFTWSVMAKQSLLVEERGQNARAKLG